MKIATYNIRVDTDYDEDWQWQYRSHNVLDLIQYHAWDVLAVQELRPRQVQDLSALPTYTLLSQERDGDGHGEGVGLLFKTSRFSVIQHGAFWLSQTPAKPSIHPDAAYPRVCVWAILQDRVTLTSSLFISTHLDNVSEEARYQGMRVILDQLHQQITDYPTVVFGDFNAEPSERVHSLLRMSFQNVCELPDIQHYGPTGTFQDFDFTRDWSTLEHIDYIYTKGFHCEKTGVITDSFNGRYASDHFPLEATAVPLE